jgi:hypothetical protein
MKENKWSYLKKSEEEKVTPCRAVLVFCWNRASCAFILHEDKQCSCGTLLAFFPKWDFPFFLNWPRIFKKTKSKLKIPFTSLTWPSQTKYFKAVLEQKPSFIHLPSQEIRSMTGMHKNSERQINVENKFCMVAPNIVGFSKSKYSRTSILRNKGGGPNFG